MLVVVVVVVFLGFPGHSILLWDATFSALYSQVGWGTHVAEAR